MIVRAAAVLVLASGLSALAACNCCGTCADNTKAEPAPAPAAQPTAAAGTTMTAKFVTDAEGNVPVVNAYCPVEPEDEIYEQKRKPELVRIWNGQAVGLCCEGCLPEWDKATPAERDAKLAAVMKKQP